MTNSVFLIAKNTFREILRDKILYALLVVSFLMLGVASAMAQLSFAEQAKITMDFTIFVLNVSVIIISIFLGAQLINREVENKTLLTLLSHPVSRSQFLIGKILGIFFIVICLTIFFSLILFLQSWYYEYGSLGELVIIMYGILLESIIILSLTILLSCFLRVSLVVTMSITLYLVGHWMESLKEITSTSTGESYIGVYAFLKYALPNLEMMNWKSLLAGNIELTQVFIGKVSLYSILWVVLYIFLSIIIFNKKDIS